jgi:4-amino-4-deoxy-L-arabinose transferase-like glycosyltransferase
MKRHRIHTPLRRWFPGIVLVIYALVVLIACVEVQWRPEWDSAIYLLTARSLARGTGYTYLGQPFILRPPGFSYALSFLSQEDGRFDFAELNFLMMVTVVVSVILVYLTLRRTEGSSRALAAVLLMGTSPLFVARFNWIQSDVPFLALLFASIFLFDLAARSSRWCVPACLVASLFLTAAIYFRSAGMILLPGAVLLVFLRQRSGYRLVALAPALIVPILVAPWLLHSRSAAMTAQRPSEQLLLFDYTTATFRVDPGDPDSDTISTSQLLQRIRTNGGHLVADLAAYVLGVRSGWAHMLVVALLAVGLVAGLVRSPTLLEWHALTYAVLLLTYFSYDARLVLPLLPPVYAYLVGGLDQIHRHLPLGSDERIAAKLRTGIAGVAFVGLILLNITALPEVLDPRLNPLRVGTVGDSWNDYQSSADWLRENTREDAVIMTEMAPITSLLSDRRVYTNRFPREPEIIRRYGINYVISFWWTNPEFELHVADIADHRWVLPSHTQEVPIRIYRIPER